MIEMVFSRPFYSPYTHPVDKVVYNPCFMCSKSLLYRVIALNFSLIHNLLYSFYHFDHQGPTSLVTPTQMDIIGVYWFFPY